MLKKVRWHAANKIAYVIKNADANPAGTVAAGGTFDHETDNTHGEHVLYQHVQECLYKIGVTDMQSVTIQVQAESINAFPATKTLDISNGETLQITTELVPSNSAGSAFTYVSSDPTKATVNAAGLVTPVAAGTSNITVTHTQSGKTDVVAITVQA